MRSIVSAGVVDQEIVAADFVRHRRDLAGWPRAVSAPPPAAMRFAPSELSNVAIDVTVADWIGSGKAEA
jgi:hypothetical protein